MYLSMSNGFSRLELFRKAAGALPDYCSTRAMILLSEHRMPLIELWHVLGTCHLSIGNTESSFLRDNYEQIVGDAKLGSPEQNERLNEFLKKIQTVMRDILEAIRLEPSPAPADNVYTALMSQHNNGATLPAETVKVDSPHLQPPKQATPSPPHQPPKQATPSPPPQPAQKRKADSPPPQPAQKRKADSPPPLAPKKPVSPLLGELVDIGIGTAAVCQWFIDKPNVGFTDQGVQCLADIALLEKNDAGAMLRLVGLNVIQIHKILKAVFPA